MGYYLCWQSAKNCQNDGTLNFFLDTGPYGTLNFKMLLLQQFSSDPIQTLRTLLTIGECRLLLVLAVGQA